MINQLFVNIKEGLKAVKPCTFYREDVPQNFKQPSFLISFYDQNPMHGINGRLKNTVNVDVSYFPEDRINAKEECWSVGQDLSRELLVPGFKIKNRNLKIEDDVLHFLFDVDYREYQEDSISKMQDMNRSTELKEE